MTAKVPENQPDGGFQPGQAVTEDGATRSMLAAARAHWVARDTLLWKRLTGAACVLHHDPVGALQLQPSGVRGGGRIRLTFVDEGPSHSVRARFPHLAGFAALRIGAADVAKVPEVVKGQIAVAAYDSEGSLVEATSVQIPGVLDDLFTYEGSLGVSFDGGVPTLRLWAPTARSVTLHLFDSSTVPQSVRVRMVSDPATGVWRAPGTPAWDRKFYLYEVEVYAPTTGRVERNLVTDPYSVSLSMNSRRSQIVDLADPDLLPAGWRGLRKPPLEAPEDSVIYELHVRDFSINDAAVPGALRGTFKAFTHSDSNGMRHLRAIASAGVTHIHLLPVFDFATVNEEKAERVEPDLARLRALPPDSDRQQAEIERLKDQDGFNWGYDPLHYTAPEGSYSTDPDGPARILEFREMVAALNAAGLRVVMDVVYNHTHASGQDEKSVLDRIVPGYYHRLDADGRVETSTCGANTATEHAMMEKLMVDSVLTWATAYKVDGFRFDLMGHHMLSNVWRVRQALDALTPERAGVNGREVYVYGEGWDFAEVAGNARGRNATQLNIGGTGIGVFNDGLRDAARGGGAFRGLQEQGFVTGLFDDPNDTPQGSPAEQRARLLHQTDLIRVGMAGNLRDARLVNADGRTVTGAEIPCGDRPAGYTLDPQENVVYASAHDNETLFDAIQLKAPAGASLSDRVRMQNLAMDLVLLSQGVPFFHAGDDMLRSKSLDRNSYNSGDWFNVLDFTYSSNNWGVGLPPGENRTHWPVLARLLASPAWRPSREDILKAVAHFQEMLRIRRSSRLFRLRTATEVAEHLWFLNTGPGQIPGLIVLWLENSGPARLEDPYDRIVVLCNASRQARTFSDARFAGAPLALHPVLAASADPTVRTARFEPAAARFTAPARTTAVFVSSAQEARPPRSV